MLLCRELLFFLSVNTSSFFVQPKTSTMTNVTLYEDMNFHVHCDPLTESSPNNKTTITTTVKTPAYGNSSWQIDLTRNANNLFISLKWLAKTTYDHYRGNVYCYPPQFLSMHVVHHKRGIISCKLEAKTFENNRSCQCKCRSE